jgi:hypothetical protein
MNERIQEMVYKLNKHVGVQWIHEDKLKFAELIVKECADQVSRKSEAISILEYFGVEE